MAFSLEIVQLKHSNLVFLDRCSSSLGSPHPVAWFTGSKAPNVVNFALNTSHLTSEVGLVVVVLHWSFKPKTTKIGFIGLNSNSVFQQVVRWEIIGKGLALTKPYVLFSCTSTAVPSSQTTVSPLLLNPATMMQLNLSNCLHNMSVFHILFAYLAPCFF